MSLLTVEDPKTVLVYQMGRVGSNRIVTALREAGFNPLHVHYFMNQGEFGTEKLPPDSLQSWKIITPVRDPIARNISAFFMQSRDPNHKVTYLDSDREQRRFELSLRKFLRAYPHNWAEQWFDKEFLPATGINPFLTPFPKLESYQIVKDFHEVLFLRTEDLDLLGATAISNFVGKSISLPSGYEERSKEYKYFLRNVQLPDWYISRMYSSEWVRHFYTTQEIYGFAEKWGG
jgi:hypothetical protein